MTDIDLQATTPKVDAVECEVCKHLHRIGAESYVRLTGQIMIGAHGGIYGPNSNNCFCRKYSCLKWLIKEIAPDTKAMPPIPQVRNPNVDLIPGLDHQVLIQPRVNYQKPALPVSVVEHPSGPYAKNEGRVLGDS